MNGWKQVLKADPIDWLLEEDNPSVRYFALTDILDRSTDDPEVRKAKGSIMQRGVVPVILAKQKDGGYWGVARDFYIRAKYKGTVWTLIILAELGADGGDMRVRKAGDFILENSRDRASGGFAYRSASDGGGEHLAVLPCLTGNMVWTLLRFGYLEDARVRRGIEWITRYQRFDDVVEEPPRGWPYDKFERCWGRHTCHMGAVKALKALAEIPADKRDKPVKDTIERGVEYFLKHHIYKRSHDLSRVSKPQWTQLGFPTMWDFDVLEALGILIKLGYRDERMKEAVARVISKQNEQGRWILERTYNGRFQANIEQKGKPSKWLTLNALRVLKEWR